MAKVVALLWQRGFVRICLLTELKAKLGGGYRLHSLPAITDKMDKKDIEVRIFPDIAAATRELQALESFGDKHFRITGPTIQELFMRLAAGKGASISLYQGKDESSDKPGKLASTPPKDAATMSVDGGPVKPGLSKRRNVGSLRQALILFMKRWTVARRNPTPIFLGFIIPIVAAAFLSLLLRGIQNPGCTLVSQVDVAHNQNLTESFNPLLVAGPSAALDVSSLGLVNQSLSSTAEALGSANTSILQAVHLVNSYQNSTTSPSKTKQTLRLEGSGWATHHLHQRSIT